MFRLEIPNGLIGLITRDGKPITVTDGIAEVVTPEDANDLVLRGAVIVPYPVTEEPHAYFGIHAVGNAE